ncbi:MAG TPA: hypothetical protein VJT75_14685 [Thermoleophilaceae bacterium]|nr:hypothetical protein [Thermoleophilaceae bacterium]
MLFAIDAQLDRAFVLNAAIWEDVPELCAVLAQDLADEQPPVAAAWLATATHQREAMIPRTAEDATDCVLEIRLARHPVIEGVALGVVVPVVSGAAAQRATEEDIADAVLGDCVL